MSTYWVSLSFYHFLKELLQNSLPWSIHILFGFLFELSKMLWNALTIVTPFLSLKETTHAYLLKISIIYNKNLILLLYLLINCISAKSTLQILSSNFFLLNFVIFGLWRLSASYWFYIDLIPLTAFRFFIKKLANHWS